MPADLRKLRNRRGMWLSVLYEFQTPVLFCAHGHTMVTILGETQGQRVAASALHRCIFAVQRHNEPPKIML